MALARPQLRLRGLRRGGVVRGALLVLNGTRKAELERAHGLAVTLADRCILVAVDGGLRACVAAGKRPDLWVGDGDSSRAPADIPQVALDRDKAFSDLSAALEQAAARKVRIAVVAGLLGGRVDHEWANLLELASWSRSFAALTAPTARGDVLITRHGCRLATEPGSTFSVFALNGTATVSLVGPQWELRRRRLRPGSHGLSNVTDRKLDLVVHNGTVALVFVPAAGRRTT